MNTREFPSVNPALLQSEMPQRTFPLDYSEQIIGSGISNLIEEAIFDSAVVKRKMSQIHPRLGSKVRYISVRRGNVRYQVRHPQPESSIRHFRIEDLTSGVTDEIICTETLIELTSFTQKDDKKTIFEHTYNSTETIDRIRGKVEEYAAKTQKALRKSGPAL